MTFRKLVCHSLMPLQSPWEPSMCQEPFQEWEKNSKQTEKQTCSSAMFPVSEEDNETAGQRVDVIPT